jgi:hypothetical protein
MAHLYVMSRSDAPGLLKVGRSDDPERRAMDLQSGHCFRITVQAVINGRGCCEQEVHRRLQHARVDGPGREWFRADLPEVLQVIAGVVGAAVNQESQPVPMEAAEEEGDHPALTPTALGNNYIVLTDSVAEASTAAQIREAIASATGMNKRRVAACLETAGLEENVANYYVGSLRTKKRVYRKDRLYAALAQTTSWLADDAMSDEA